MVFLLLCILICIICSTPRTVAFHYLACTITMIYANPMAFHRIFDCMLFRLVPPARQRFRCDEEQCLAFAILTSLRRSGCAHGYAVVSLQRVDLLAIFAKSLAGRYLCMRELLLRAERTTTHLRMILMSKISS